MWLLTAIFTVLEVLLIAVMTRRILGVPIGWPRTLLVSLLISCSLGGILTELMEATGAGEQKPGLAVAMLVLGSAWIFALGVAVLVIGETIFPTGSLPSPLAPLRGWRARRRRTKRYAQIVALAVKHGLGGYLRASVRTRPADAGVARSLTKALNDAGVTFVKLGQTLSTRQDLLSEEFVRELSTLQTKATPEPWTEIEKVLTASLNRPLDEVFADISREPLAAASVAQVHAARLLDGTEVVVKVQRPSARAKITADVEIILRMARWLGRTTAWGRSLGVNALAEGFAASLNEELDYRIELRNMTAIAGTEIVIPKAYPTLSSSTVLVMDRLDGKPVSESGVKSAELPEQLLRVILRQVLVTGVFHADLHPGNVFVMRSGGLGLLDFGSVGRLDKSTRSTLAGLLFAIDRDDPLAATDALTELLGRPEHLNERELERDLGQIMLQIQPGNSAALFSSLFTLITRHQFAIPPQLAAAFRALASLEGTLTVISPGFDLITQARSFGSDLVADSLRPEAVRETVQTQLMTLIPMLQRLPRRINTITEALEQGRLTVNVRALADPRDRSFLSGLVQQIIVAFIAGATALGAIALLITDSGPKVSTNVQLFDLLGYALLFVSFVLGLRALAQALRSAPH